jgi:tetratricopeptide (TPR) repeat protein
MRESRREELALESNHFSEQAAYAHLDGAHEYALAASDRAIKAHERLLRARRGDREVVEVLAHRYRDRADIRRELGRSMERRSDQVGAAAQFRAGIADGERAIALYRESGAGEGGVYPLWVPSVQLLVGELLAWTGDAGAAREEADRAMPAYRAVPVEQEQSALDLAHALSRYADVLERTGARDEALAARREAVAFYRRHLGPDGRLWRNRLSRGTAWVSTPTWERWCETAVSLARQLESVGLEAAPEALAALQDAAEGFAGLVPDHMLSRLLPGVQGHVDRMDRVVGALEAWLVELGHHELADAYRRTSARLVSYGGGHDWPAVLRQLRPALDAALAP